MSMIADSTADSAEKRRVEKCQIQAGIQEYRVARPIETKRGGGVELSCNQFQDGESSGWSRGPPGTSEGRAVDRPCGSRCGCHAELAGQSWQLPFGYGIEPAG